MYSSKSNFLAIIDRYPFDSSPNVLQGPFESDSIEKPESLCWLPFFFLAGGKQGGPQRGTVLSSSMPLPAARPQSAVQAKQAAAPIKASQPQRPLGQGINRFTKDPPKPAPRTPRGGGGVRNSNDYSQG